MPGLSKQIDKGDLESVVLRRNKRAGSNKGSSRASSLDRAGSSSISDLSDTDLAEIERLIDTHANMADLIPRHKLIAYFARGDTSIEKILSAGSEITIRLIPRDKLVAYANGGSSNIEKILSSGSSRAIDLIPESKLVAYANKGHNNIEKILISRSHKAIRLIPRVKLIAYAGRSDHSLEIILDSESDKAIDLIPEDKLVAYARKGSRNIERILSSDSTRLIDLIPDDRLVAYARRDTRNIEKIFNSQSIRAIDLIPDDKLAAYARKGNRFIERILDTRSIRAIDLISLVSLKAYASQGDKCIEKILNSRSAKAIGLIPADILVSYANQGDDYIEKIFNSQSIRAIDLVADQIQAYANQPGDYHIETILGSESDRAISLVADQIKAYASRNDYYLEAVLSYRSEKAIDLIADQLITYAKKGNSNIEKILSTRSVKAISLIPADHLIVYASQGDGSIEKILSSQSARAVLLIPSEKLAAYASQGDEYIDEIFNSRSERAIDLIPADKLVAYASQGNEYIDEIFNSRSERAIDLIPHGKLIAYAKQGGENIEKILSSKSYQIIRWIPRDKLVAYADQGDKNIEKILNSRSDIAIDSIPINKLIAYANQGDKNIERILNSEYDKAIKLIPHEQLAMYANTMRRRFQQVSSAQSSLDEVILEECLPGPSGFHHPLRRTRDAANTFCEFSWKDVDTFNDEKEHTRVLNKININSENFIALLEDPTTSASKRTQLLQLPTKVLVTGAEKERVFNLAKQQSTLLYVNKVNRVAGMATYGMISKNVLKDFLQEDYPGVAINLGFVAGGVGFSKVAEAAAIKGEELVVNGQHLLGQSLKLASPFLARGTSAFFAYDLVQQIKGYREGNPDALVGVGADSFYLTLDASELGIETAEFLGLVEGVSPVTGPAGAATGALVFIGTDVYLAIKQVNREDVLIHLTNAEKVEESLRALIGMKPKHEIEMLLEEKQINTQLYLQGFSFLENNTNIQWYILPTAKIEQKCEVKWTKEECISNYGGVGKFMCHPPKIESEGCEMIGWEMHLDNIVMLDQKRENITRSRTKPDVNEGNLFCVPVAILPVLEEDPPSKGKKVSSFTRTDIDQHLRSIEALVEDIIKISNKAKGITSHEDTYFCDQAMGIEYAKSRTGNTTLMVLGDGDDTVEGFPYADHLVLLGNGHKDIILGEGDDTFLLEGNITTGAIFGGGGINTLDLGAFAKEQKLVSVISNAGSFSGESQGTLWAQSTLANGHRLYSSELASTNNPLEINQIHHFLLRADRRDYMEVACRARFIDARGGKGDNPVETMDMLIIPKKEHCVYDLKLIVRSYTLIGNYAKHKNSQFTYIVPRINKGHAKVNLADSDGAHRFVFANTLLDLHALKWDHENNIIFDFVTPKNRFKLKISMQATNDKLLYQLGDNTEIKVLGDHFYAFQSTNRSVEEIIKDNPSMAERLNLTMIMQSSLTNESIAIGHGKHDVLHNDPYRRSHLVGNGGENIFVITSGYQILDESQLPLPEVVIYDTDDKNLIDTLDLRQIRKQLQSDLNLKIKERVRLVVDTHDMAIELFASQHALESFVTVRLKDALLKHWYKKVHVMLSHVPLELSTFGLKPLPLVFAHDKDIIIINPKDVDQHTQLLIAKKAGDYRFFQLGNDLMLTNAFASNLTETERYAFLFQTFYQTPKLASLSIKFADKELMLTHEMDAIKHGADFLLERAQLNRTIHDTLFNKPEIEAVQSLVRRTRGIKAKEMKEGKTVWGRFQAFIARMNQAERVLSHTKHDVTNPLDIAEQRVGTVIPINEPNPHRISWAMQGNVSTFFQSVSVLPSTSKNDSRIQSPGLLRIF